MSANSKIEWCDHTFNPWEGCQKAGPGCDHCYAEARNARFGGGTASNWGPGAPRRRTSAANWAKPLQWNAQAAAFMAQHGRRQRVFCASLADVFDNAVDPQWRADLFELIAATPNLDWLLLTKRIGNVHRMIDLTMDAIDHRQECGATEIVRSPWPWPNVWIGATIVNQEEADRDIPRLLEVPARVRFLSMEPLLGSVNLRSIPHGDGELDALKPCTWEEAIDLWRDTSESWVEDFEDWYGVILSDGLTGPCHAGIDWVIVGGESGPGARPMHPDWARSLRDECEAAGVPFLFKQWGHWQIASRANGHYDSDMASNSAVWLDHDGTTAKPSSLGMTNAYAMAPVGKKAAGRLLDGRTWDGVPA